MNTTEKNQIIELDKIEVSQLSDFQKFKEKQISIVKENPFIEISDYSSYQKAKEARTALVRARTAIEKQDKLIASKISAFRKRVIGLKKELIDISIEAENKQQAEVKRWEEIKAAEKAEKERLEQERKERIKAQIEEFYNAEMNKIGILTYKDIKEEHIKIGAGVNTSEFEEFEDEFEEKCKVLEMMRGHKIISLKQQEEQRLEKERIKKEKEGLEKKKREAEEKLKAERESIRSAQEKIEQERREIEEARLKIENEKRLKREAEEKAERDRLEAEQAKIEEAKRKKREEALKSDKEKIVNYINSLKFGDIPNIKDDKLNELMKHFTAKINKLKELFEKEVWKS